MIFIPAIDLRGGRVVRLIRGSFSEELVWGDNPALFAREFEKQGAEWLHMVDLDGALDGQCRNLDGLKRVRDETRLKIQFGGGLRSVESIESVLALGVQRVVLGTRGLDQAFVKLVLSRFPLQVAVSLDQHEGLVRTQAWTTSSKVSHVDVMDQLKDWGLRYLVYTNIARDGTLSGPDLEGLDAVLKRAGSMGVILSGGVSSLDDIRRIAAVRDQNFYGVIVGRALYEKRFSVEDALSTIRDAG